ncbi:MAG: GNAT family N-acetyltransferase [Candidatus Thiodiazotropha sp. (ex Dulcina madagascariensis)]|nr:GNAT family N-acetyltransferase [Candidatus Thiodiazotropha sp. (ex Dulcina madagascariensis)]MCU7927608.1 GNAT family N-acetyltransferase [Candidatus Thiodiazotropha sp. (ex Dulcina madagascariensis)]
MANNDMLIKLYALDFSWNSIHEQVESDVTIRKPIGPDRPQLLSWAEMHFPALWVGELQQALANMPCSCFVAQRGSSLLGFACYDATALGYFGPLGVVENSRGAGIGRSLTEACLLEMRLKGYGYAIVGMAGSADFYRKVADAVEIPDSYPGIYRATLELAEIPNGHQG